MTNDDRDAETLRFIQGYIDENGWPPSRREIIAGVDRISASAGQKRVDNLVKKGLITVRPNIPRGIKITPEGRQVLAGTVMKAETEEL